MKVTSSWLFAFLLILLNQIVYAQSSEEVKCWTIDNQLNWSDFKGQVQDSLDYNAVCAAKINVQGFWDAGLPNFKVTNCFMKNQSWARDTTYDEGLQHEQMHFDISEIHARLIRKAIDSLRNSKIKDIDIYSQKIQELLSRKNSVNAKFDRETAHGVYKGKQEKWETKIDSCLNSLSPYMVN